MWNINSIFAAYKEFFFGTSIKMNPNVKEITDKDLIIKAKKIGIKKPNTMSTKKTVKYAQQTAEKTQITQNLPV